jgi:hypothetical protein
LVGSSSFVSLDPGQSRHLIADCPFGDWGMGGGYHARWTGTDQPQDVGVIATGRTGFDDPGWFLDVKNTAGLGGATFEISVQVVCISTDH